MKLPERIKALADAAWSRQDLPEPLSVRPKTILMWVARDKMLVDRIAELEYQINYGRQMRNPPCAYSSSPDYFTPALIAASAVAFSNSFTQSCE